MGKTFTWKGEERYVSKDKERVYTLKGTIDRGRIDKDGVYHDEYGILQGSVDAEKGVRNIGGDHMGQVRGDWSDRDNSTSSECMDMLLNGVIAAMALTVYGAEKIVESTGKGVACILRKAFGIKEENIPSNEPILSENGMQNIQEHAEKSKEKKNDKTIGR